MRAIVLKEFGGVENFQLTSVTDPVPGDAEVLVRIRAAAFNPIDYQMRKGDPESKLLRSPILGREFAGEVLETGKMVDDFSAGDKVAAYTGSLASNGCYAELISVPAALLARIPPSLSYVQAAALPMSGMTALQCFRRMNIPEEAAVFIAGGAGAVGSMLIRLLMAHGNLRLFTTAGSQNSIHELKTLSLTERQIINYKKEPVLSTVRERSGLTYFPFVVDLVGGKFSEYCAELVDVFGCYADITNLGTPEAKELLFDKAATILNIANYAPALKAAVDSTGYYGHTLQQLFEMITSGRISPPSTQIIGELGVETVRAAHIMMENNATGGKKPVMVLS